MDFGDCNECGEYKYLENGVCRSCAPTYIQVYEIGGSELVDALEQLRDNGKNLPPSAKSGHDTLIDELLAQDLQRGIAVTEGVVDDLRDALDAYEAGHPNCDSSVSESLNSLNNIDEAGHDAGFFGAIQ